MSDDADNRTWSVYHRFRVRAPCDEPFMIDEMRFDPDELEAFQAALDVLEAERENAKDPTP